MVEEQTNKPASPAESVAQVNTSRSRSLSIWISGIAFLILPMLQVIGILLPQIQGRMEDAKPDIRLAVGICIGLIGLGLLFRNRVCLIIARILSVLGILFVFFSIFASMATPYGGGPNLSHLVGFIIVIGWLFSWSTEAKIYCTKK